MYFVEELNNQVALLVGSTAFEVRKKQDNSSGVLIFTKDHLAEILGSAEMIQSTLFFVLMRN
jgi:hypothetical protein